MDPRAFEPPAQVELGTIAHRVDICLGVTCAHRGKGCGELLWGTSDFALVNGVAGQGGNPFLKGLARARHGLQHEGQANGRVAARSDLGDDDAAVSLAADDRSLGHHLLHHVHLADRREKDRAVVSRGRVCNGLRGGKGGDDRTGPPHGRRLHR